MNTQEIVLVEHRAKPQLQYRKCGKRGCRTCREGKGHGPYWYLYARVGGKLTSKYIGKELPAQQEDSHA